MRLSHIIKRQQITTACFSSNLLILSHLTACSNGMILGGASQTQEATTQSGAGKGKTEPSDEFEQSSSPSNVSGSYLANCAPQSSSGSALPSDTVTVICSYSDPNNSGKPMEGQLNQGEVEVTLSNGKKLVLKLQPQPTSNGTSTLQSRFDISKTDLQQMQEIKHIDLQMSHNGKSVELTSQNISSEMALPQAEIPMEDSDNPNTPEFGLVGKVYALPENLVGKVYTSATPDPFANLPSTNSVGTVELPPWYLSQPKNFLNENSKNFAKKTSTWKNDRTDLTEQTLKNLRDAFFIPTPNHRPNPLERFAGGFRLSNNVNPKEFLVRLEGKIKFPKSGKYYLQVNASTAARVLIDNKLILSAVPKDFQEWASAATLNDTTQREATTYTIRIDYIFSESSNTQVKMRHPTSPTLNLNWKKPKDDGNFNYHGENVSIPYWNFQP